MVDDDPDDIMFVRDALKQMYPEIGFIELQHGDALLEYLECAVANGNDECPLPSMILLDLNMPVKGGFETLMEMKKDPRFSSIPVIVFSTSRLAEDTDRALRMGAVSYITKPDIYDDHLKIVHRIVVDWFH